MSFNAGAKLFVVRDKDRNVVSGPFDNKKEAKKARNDFGVGPDPRLSSHAQGYHISPGPDHFKTRRKTLVTRDVSL
jgi:hypothetical protein